MAALTLPLFAYATLAERFTLERLLGARPELTLSTAELPDYEKVWMRGLGYPFVAQRPGSHVVGALVEGLRPEDYLKLDEYEGIAEGDYLRVRVSVRPHGVRPPEQVEAYVYVLGPRWEQRLL